MAISKETGIGVRVKLKLVDHPNEPTVLGTIENKGSDGFLIRLDSPYGHDGCWYAINQNQMEEPKSYELYGKPTELETKSYWFSDYDFNQIYYVQGGCKKMVSSIIRKTDEEVKVVCSYGTEPFMALVAFLEQTINNNYQGSTYEDSMFKQIVTPDSCSDKYCFIRANEIVYSVPVSETMDTLKRLR